MRYFVRIATRARWPGEGEDIEAFRDKALADFTRRPGDGDGVSVFEVASPDDEAAVERVVASIACERAPNRRIENVDVLILSEDDVGTLGAIERTPQHCNSPVCGVIEAHRSLDWAQDELNRLATGLLERHARVRRFTKNDVRRILTDLDREDLEAGENADAVWSSLEENRDLWTKALDEEARKRKRSKQSAQPSGQGDSDANRPAEPPAGGTPRSSSPSPELVPRAPPVPPTPTAPPETRRGGCAAWLAVAVVIALMLATVWCRT